MRHSGFLFALCCSALCSSVLANIVHQHTEDMVNNYDGVNYATFTTTESTSTGQITGRVFNSGVECDNTVDGNTTSATDVNGNIVHGCGNVISNITNGTVPVKVSVQGLRNVVEDDIVTSDHYSDLGMNIGAPSEAAVENTIVGNAGTKIKLDGVGNVVLHNNAAGSITIHSNSNNNTVVNNDAISMHFDNADNSLISNNSISAGDGEGGGTIALDVVQNTALVNNVADYVNLNEASGDLIENNVLRAGGIEIDYGYNLTISHNVADYIGLGTDTSVVVESNVVDDQGGLSNGGISISNNKHSIIKKNHAGLFLQLETSDTSVDIESNDVDYDLDVFRSANVTAKHNQAYKLEFTDDNAVVANGNTVELEAQIKSVNNGTFTNNSVYEMDVDNVNDIVFTGERGNKDGYPYALTEKGYRKVSRTGVKNPMYASVVRFAGGTEISAITSNASAVAARDHKTTAVSAAQALAMQAQLAALVTSQGATNTALQALVANLTATVDTLKSGFCPPAAAGRHLLSTLTPIVPPAECVKPVTTKPTTTNPTDIVTTTLSLSGVDLASFSTASVAAALSSLAGINVTDVDVVVTDFPVSTTVSFTGVALTSLTASQVTGIINAIDAKLPATAMVPALGLVTPAGRRLLDLSFPVTVTAVGASATQAAATQTAVTSAATLAAAALAAGLQSSAASATPATVSAVMTVTVRAASAASAANIAATLSPSNSAAISAQLVAAGVTHTGVTITQPVLSKPAVPQASNAGISGQDKKDLVALLVLLVIPAAGAAYYGGKYMERRRAEQAACTQVYGVEHVGKAVDVVVVDSA